MIDVEHSYILGLVIYLVEFWKSLNHHFSSSPTMPLDLPLGDDGVDDGPDLFDLQQQPAANTKKPTKKPPKAVRQKSAPKVVATKKPATRQTKLKLPSSSSTAAGPGVGLGTGLSLPDDDDTGNVFDFDLSARLPTPTSILVPQPDDPGMMLPFDDFTLKGAAAKIPSVVHHPYRDLDPMLLGPPRHCMEELKDTLWEVYSVPRLQPIMNSLPGGKCRRPFDIKTFWDFREPNYQRALLQDIASLQPLCIMLCPPCTYVCQLMHSNWNRMKSGKRTINLVDACGHIDFSMWIASIQHHQQRYFAFEHPAGSLAWDRDSVTLQHKIFKAFI